jgi:hypothetical protein
MKLPNKLGRKMIEALRFARAYPGWHTFAPEARPEIVRLSLRGLVRVNQHRQFKAV